MTGTVNVDETTHGFSPKVLDRAMVLEFDKVNLERLRGDGSTVDAGGYRFPETLAPFGLASPQDYASLLLRPSTNIWWRLTTFSRRHGFISGTGPP